MPFSPNHFAELNLLLQFPGTSAQAGIKVHRHGARTVQRGGLGFGFWVRPGVARAATFLPVVALVLARQQLAACGGRPDELGEAPKGQQSVWRLADQGPTTEDQCCGNLESQTCDSQDAHAHKNTHTHRFTP